MNMGLSKVIFGEHRLDLTADTIIPDKLLKGYTAHSADGEPISGTCEFDVDSSNVTATQAEVLAPKTFAKDGRVLPGTMKNNGSVVGTISTKAEQYNVPQGFHDGGGKVSIAATEQAKLIEKNIRQGVSILGVLGSMSGSEDIVAQTKTVTPTIEGFEVLPDDGYTHLSQVTVGGIPYTITDNAAGGKTLTIG